MHCGDVKAMITSRPQFWKLNFGAKKLNSNKSGISRGCPGSAGYALVSLRARLLERQLRRYPHPSLHASVFRLQDWIPGNGYTV